MIDYLNLDMWIFVGIRDVLVLDPPDIVNWFFYVLNNKKLLILFIMSPMFWFVLIEQESTITFISSFNFEGKNSDS